MKLEFSNLHFDGEIQTTWQIRLRICGDFELWVGEQLIYSEIEFCLIEFAVELGRWLAIATDLGPNFSYNSMESNVEDLIRFTRLQPGRWQVFAAHQDKPAESEITTSELNDAALRFIRRLRTQLQPQWDIVQLLDDPQARENLRRKLQQDQE